MAYLDLYNLAFDDANDLHKKAAVAVVVATRAVIAEDPETPQHDSRLAWARWIIASPSRVLTEAHRAMLHLLADGTVAAAGNAAADGGVQSAMNDIVGWLAKGGYR